MASCIQFTSSEYTLGQRHRFVNGLVNDACETPFNEIESLPDKSIIDRLFKIDIAVKKKNVAFVLQTLKDNDLFCVSRALKAKWLVEDRDLINPKYLEETLFPEMTMPAVKKLKHWLYINLRDCSRAENFYQYYKINNFDYAIKFLSHCSNGFVMNEFSKILTKISPHHLKVLCEKYTKVAKIYYDALESNDEVTQRYLENEYTYYESIKSLLKSDPQLFFSIIEKYYNLKDFPKFNRTSTKYIMQHHKNRFIAKPELYFVYLLHVPTVANSLSEKECEDLVLNLARANYLGSWFCYRSVEPLIKGIAPPKRPALKKIVFVNKNVGETVDHWPYELPSTPCVALGYDEHAFIDMEFEPLSPIIPDLEIRPFPKKRKIMKRCMKSKAHYVSILCEGGSGKTELEKLFEEYRFVGFERTLYELRGRIRVASSADSRRDMMLVLVSKSGGLVSNVDALLHFTEQYSNEPAHIRAAILRSLVRRAAVWRLPEKTWQRLLFLGRDLGLDGTKPDADCSEGLHAVVLRQLISNGNCEPTISKLFLEDFSTFAEYSLKHDEKMCVAHGLTNMLVATAIHAEPEEGIELLNKAFDVLQRYDITIQSTSKVVETVKSLAERDCIATRPLLRRLYDMRVARRELFRENLEFRQDNAAIMNILRHDPGLLNTDTIVNMMLSWASYRYNKQNVDRFIDKLAVYFYEKGGIGERLRSAIQVKICQELTSERLIVSLVGPLAGLLGQDLELEIRKWDEISKDYQRLAAVLRSNAHRAKPSPDVLAWGWQFVGVKAIATRLYRGKLVDVSSQVLNLAAERRTSRLALQLCKLAKSTITQTYTTVSSNRPGVALRGAILYFRNHVYEIEQVWNIIKPVLLNIDLSSRDSLQKLLRQTNRVPIHIRPDFCAMSYLALKKITNSNNDVVLGEFTKLVSDIRPEMIENVLSQMLKNNLINEKMTDEEKIMPKTFSPALFIRYLLMCTSNDEQEQRIKNIGEPFLKVIDAFLNEDSKFIDDTFKGNIVDQTIKSLKYNVAFFNPQYVSCLPVFEKVNCWMSTFLPKEDNFDKYVYIHLTMLYYKAVKQTIKQLPEVFDDPKRKNIEGAEAVGYTFGRYIAKEVSELVCQYFDSIIELYATGLMDYLGEYIIYGPSRAKFVAKVIQGIISESVDLHRRLAVYILKDCRYNLVNSDVDELINMMKIEKDKNIQLFSFAEL